MKSDANERRTLNEGGTATVGLRRLCALAAGSLATGVLLAVSFPPSPVSLLAWVALVPVLVALDRPLGDRRGTRWLAVLALWLGGMALGTAGFFWVRHVTVMGMLLLGFYISLYFVAFAAIVRWLSLRERRTQNEQAVPQTRNPQLATRNWRLPLAISVPLTWTALECVRSVVFTGLPWLLLAHTQYKNLPVIQIADLTGAAGVTFWLAAVNGFVADGILLVLHRGARVGLARLLAGAAFVAAITAGGQWYGMHRLRTLPTKTGPSIAVIQGNIPQDVKNLMTAETIREIFWKHVDLTRNALRAAEPPDVVIWPETMAVPGMLDARNNVPENGFLSALTTFQRQSALLVGAVSYRDEDGKIIENGAFFLPKGGNGPAGQYAKMHLVPFGEYIPLKPLIGWLIGPMVPYDVGLTPGREHSLFEVNGWRLAPTVCFEDAFPGVVAGFSRQSWEQADVIVNMTNEGWFKDGTELDQHLAIAVFRAVENRKGFVRAANTGISAFIAPTGQIISTLEVDGKDREVSGILHGVAMTSDVASQYLLTGEWFGICCTAAFFLTVVVLGRNGFLLFVRTPLHIIRRKQ